MEDIYDFLRAEREELRAINKKQRQEIDKLACQNGMLSAALAFFGEKGKEILAEIKGEYDGV